MFITANNRNEMIVRRVPYSLLDGFPKDQHVDAFQRRHLPDPEHRGHLVVFAANVQTIWAKGHGSDASLGVKLVVVGSTEGYIEGSSHDVSI